MSKSIPKPASSSMNKSLDSLLVVPKQSLEGIPLVAIVIQVHHAAPQRTLQQLGILAEHPHHGPPRYRRKRPPPLLALAVHLAQASLLARKLEQSKHCPAKNVEHNLLVDGVVPVSPKDKVPRYRTRKEGMVPRL